MNGVSGATVRTGNIVTGHILPVSPRSVIPAVSLIGLPQRTLLLQVQHLTGLPFREQWPML